MFLISRLGYTQIDIDKIERTKFVFLHYDDRDPVKRDTPVKVSQLKAVEIVGKWGFASGCARATFHRTACRTASCGLDTILFERV